MSNYDSANYDVERANHSAEWTDAGVSEANLLARAQVHATLALVDAIRDLTPKPVDPEPLPGQCANCGHNADVHDEETGPCLIEESDGNGCWCDGFEAS